MKTFNQLSEELNDRAVSTKIRQALIEVIREILPGNKWHGNASSVLNLKRKNSRVFTIPHSRMEALGVTIYRHRNSDQRPTHEQVYDVIDELLDRWFEKVKHIPGTSKSSGWSTWGIRYNKPQ